MANADWYSFLRFTSNADGIMRAIAVFLLGIVALLYSTVFEAEYPSKMIALYSYPWWRFLMIILVITGALWCPRVGILVALVAFFYLSDMETLVNPFIVA